MTVPTRGMKAPQTLCCDVQTTLKSELQLQSYGPLTLGKVTVMGVDPAPLYVTLGGRAVDFSFDDTTKVIFSFVFHRPEITGMVDWEIKKKIFL